MSTPQRDDPANRKASKSQLKREAHALQALGESLVSLPESQLTEIPMPAKLLEAVHDARRIKSRGALHRQRQYLGRLMREIDPAPIRAALERLRERERHAALQFKRVEAWRDELIREAEPAIAAFVAICPDADAARLQRLVRDAAQERDGGRPARSARQLFRYVKGLLDPEA